MPSTYTTNLTVELQAPTEKINIWGADLNSNVLTPLDEAIASTLTKTITGDTTLTSGNGSASNEWRKPIWVFTGSLSSSANITAPQRSGVRIVSNATGQNLVLKTAVSTSTVTVPTGTTVKVRFDGTDCFRILDTNYGGTELKNIATPTLAGSAATKAYADALALSTALPTSGTVGRVIVDNGTTGVYGAVDLANANAVTGALPIANGGTGGNTAELARNAILPATAGNALEVLRVNAAGTGYETAPASSGAIALLASATASNSATVDFTSLIDSTYDEYEIHIINAVPATDNVGFWMRTSTDAGANWDAGASDYAYGVVLFRNSSTGVVNDNSTGAAQISLAASYNLQTDANCAGWSGKITIFKPSAAQYCLFGIEGSFSRAPLTDLARVSGTAVRGAVADVTGIRFLMSSDNIASGEFKLYGVQKS